MIRSHRLAATLIAASAALLAVCAGSLAQQQEKQMAAPPQAAQPAAPQLQQIALTDKQVQGLLNSQKEMDEITSKLPDDPSKPPDAKTMGELDAVAKKYGFASYAEYGNVAANVDMLLDGFDPKTKKFVGIEASLKNQIAVIQSDTKMPANDKKEALDELNDSLKNAPKVQFQANIEVVAKYYDKLNDALRAQE